MPWIHYLRTAAQGVWHDCLLEGIASGDIGCMRNRNLSAQNSLMQFGCRVRCIPGLGALIQGLIELSDWREYQGLQQNSPDWIWHYICLLPGTASFYLSKFAFLITGCSIAFSHFSSICDIDCWICICFTKDYIDLALLFPCLNVIQAG